MESEESHFFYFGYGSNLSTDRIRVNNPSAVAVGPALLNGYKLDFNYFSKVKKGILFMNRRKFEAE